MTPSGRWRASGLRTRVTVLAGAAVGLALLAGALLLLSLLRTGLTSAVDDRALQRIDEVERLLVEGRLPEVVPAGDPAVLVQVLDAGGVTAATTGTSRVVPLLTPDELRAARRSGDPVEVGGDRVGYATGLRVLVRPVSGDRSVLAGVPVTAVDDPLRLVRLSLAVGLPLLLGAACAGVWLTVGRTLRPVEALRAGADEVTAAEPARRLPVPPAADEVRRLAETLNGMLDRLEAGGVRQRSFVADAAHELRSPLAALRTTLEVALLHPEPDEVDAVLRAALDDALRMGRLVEDLLLLARQGAVAADEVRTDLVAVVHRVTEDLTGRPGSSDARVPLVRLELPDRPVLAAIAVDPAARVVRNLLENAQRHAADLVTVTVVPVGAGTVQLRVGDDGPGIAPADRERVFERFTRLDSPRSRDGGGSGLGLAIVRELARTRGGEVAVEQADEGGALLVVSLPAVDA